MADAEEEGAEEDVVYTGVVKKVSAKDPQKFIVECPEALEAYGVPVLLPASKKPQNVSLGDTISFTVNPLKPLITWAERAAKKKRKAGDEEEEAATAVYTGKVLGPSEKQPSLYIVDCPVVTQWYGIEARMPEKLWPDGLELGGDINFSIKETATGKPLIVWCEYAPEIRKAKKPKGSSFVSGVSGSVEMRDAESAIEAWALDGSEFKGVLLSVVHHPDTVDGLMFRVTGIPSGTEWSELKQFFRKAGEVGMVKVHNPYALGVIKFDDAATAEMALTLFGTTCKGHELVVHLDKYCKEGKTIRVPGLPPGFQPSDLREHFMEIGTVTNCTVREVIPG